LALLGAMLCAVRGCSGDAFACEDDAQCAGGMCQPNGYCSFPADDCDSGQRYGEHAPSGIAGECVPLDDSTSGSGSTTSATSTTSADTSTSISTGETTSGSTLPVTATESSSSTGGADTSTSGSGSTGTTGEPVDPDLVLWLELDEAPNPVHDSSLNELHGLCMGCFAEGMGPIDGTYVFGQPGQAVVVEHDPAFVLDELSVAVWIRADSPPAMESSTIISKPVNNGVWNSWQLEYRVTPMGTGVRFHVGDGSSLVAANVLTEVGNWTHIVGTWDATTVALYIDGALVDSMGSMGYVVAWDDNPVYVGADANGGDIVWELVGEIDDVRIYNRALDPREITELAAR
jgi:hypothetical protein